MNTKYPNADTSPERLAHIENSYVYWKDDLPQRRAFPPPANYYEHMLRDLLAMLEEQRWRKLSEEEPAQFQNVDMAITLLNRPTIVKIVTYQSNDYLNSKYGRYWRPIPDPKATE